ncbi:hypothetical protein HJC23_009782 [Cyclotella cryptica]|uniref:C-CAP/cofactor C-like domain-containing protein n=1 Tax=Cyclotella cryptica TaxID=29204 RepID=A0ABD3PS30_9STRA|eukprot:CCRYP_012142-RA/>CCRYP_012142-RA protein AED:0.41 eAED:0.41 QI:0/-1/0/1/-1/1/1/0/289
MKNQYVASDGTVFTDRSLYRKHEMETQYTFRGKENATLTKKPGSVKGQPFDIIDCKNCSILVLDHCDQVQIDDVVDSTIFIGASSGSVFIRNCRNCSFTIACKQLRTRDSMDCTLNLYCMTDPAIETSTGIRFAPFNGAYEGHFKALVDAGLDLSINKWSAVFDFNDPSETQENWCIVTEDEREPLWCPLGPADCCMADGSSARRLFVTPANCNVIEDGENMSDSTDTDKTEAEQSNLGEGNTNRIILFGQRLWGIMSYSISSISAFCLGFILSGFKTSQSLLTFSRAN